jgi:hypothetical protein
MFLTKPEVDALGKLGLPEVKESNKWLVLHVKGDGIRAPRNWNAKVYMNKEGDLKVVTTDELVLSKLLGKSPLSASPLFTSPEGITRVISIDDSGWGFPLGGTLVGVHDTIDNSFHYGEVAVGHYQSPLFEEKAYLWASANAVVKILGRLNKGNADVFDFRTIGKDVLFRVCSGYVNTGIVKELRERGFNVETCTIGEPLQSALEKEHREYIKRLTNADVYYDPKDLVETSIGRAFGEVIEWMVRNDKLSMAKSGWGYFKKRAASGPIPSKVIVDEINEYSKEETAGADGGK